MAGSENFNFSMYASHLLIQENHTSHISNSPGSNEQDDESYCKGSPGSIGEFLPESATRNKPGSARFGTAGEQALSEATGGSMGVVPCTPLMSQNQGSQRDSQGDSQGHSQGHSQGDSQGAQSTSSAAESTGEDGLQLSSTGNTSEGEPGRKLLTTRSGREIRKPFRFRDRSFRSKGDVSSNQAR